MPELGRVLASESGCLNRITKQKADEVHASGEVYLIGEYDEKGQLVRVTKMYRGEVFFEYNYSYHGNGRLKSARVARRRAGEALGVERARAAA